MATTPIDDVIPFVQYVAAPGADTFDFGWWIREIGDLIVFIDGVPTDDFSVTGVQVVTGGQIVLGTPLAGGEILTISTAYPFERLTGFVTSGSLRADALNLELSYLVACILQIARDLQRSLKLSPASQADPALVVLPEPEDDTVLAWDGDSGALKNGPTTAQVDEAIASGAVAQAAAADAEAARAAIAAMNIVGGGDGFYNVLAYGAKGDGTTDDTAAIQDALTVSDVRDGATVVFPAGYIFKCTSGFSITTKKRLTGGGKLSFTAGMTNASGLTLQATGCVVVGLELDNPNKLNGMTGSRNIGISVKADECLVAQNKLTNWGNTIVVESSGEYMRCIVTGNHCLDCLGHDGTVEDRGDGIVIWGAQAIVANNIVKLADSAVDGRIGIHGEGLSVFHVSSPTHSDSMITFVGNTVSGKWRRNMVFEDVYNCTMVGNNLADATWWNAAIIKTRNCSIVGNTIEYTRLVTDTQGSDFTPVRCPIMVYGNAYDNVVSDNNVRLLSTSVADCMIRLYGNAGKAISAITQASPGVITSNGHGLTNGTRIMIDQVVGMTQLNENYYLVAAATTNTFTLTDTAGTAIDTSGFTAYSSGGAIFWDRPTRTTVQGNNLYSFSTTACVGINLGATTYGSRILNNRVEGRMGDMIYGFQPDRISFCGNELVNRNGALVGRGIHIEGSSQINRKISGNIIRNSTTAINCVNASGHMITDNYIENATFGVDCFGATGCLVHGNYFIDVTTPTPNVGSIGSNIAKDNNNILGKAIFTWNPGSTASGSIVQKTGITLTGAVAGDVILVHPPYDTTGWFFTGTVTAADTVTVTGYNISGSTSDLANNTGWKISRLGVS